MAIREGAWDCPSCGRKRNRGPEKHCAGCGVPRGSEVRFYLPEDAPEITDPDALARAGSGPDWTCSYCEGDNRADADYCTGCGASKEGAPPRAVIEYRGAPPGPPAEKSRPTPPPPETAVAREEPPKKKKGCARFGCLGLILAALATFWLTRPDDAVLTLQSFAWEHSVEVEVARTVTREAWEGEVPAGARILGRERAIYEHKQTRIGSETKTRTVTEQVQVGTEQVKVGVRDLGNGYFEDIYEDRPIYETRRREETYEEPIYRSDPIYRTRIRYQIEVWESARTEKASGRDHSPRWPLVRDTARERPGKREGIYTATFKSTEGDLYTYTTRNFKEWSRLELGQRYQAKVLGDRVRSLEPLRLEE